MAPTQPALIVPAGPLEFAKVDEELTRERADALLRRPVASGCVALELDWEAVARTHVHPLRLEILERMARSSDPVSVVELSRELKRSLGVVAYHVRQLEERRLIQAAGSRPRRGAIEHFYRIV